MNTTGPAIPPTALKAEQTVLGHMLKWGDTYPELRSEQFADPIHSDIFERIRRRSDQRMPVSTAAIIDDFAHSDVLDEVGGSVYLEQIAAQAPDFDEAADAAALVRDCWARREIINLGEHLSTLGNDAIRGGFDAGGVSGAEQARYIAVSLQPVTSRLAAITGGSHAA